MSKKDAIGEYMKLYRIFVLGGMGMFIVFTIEPIFKEVNKFGYWSFIIFGLLGLIGSIYSFIKFKNKLKEYNNLTGKNYSSFYYLFVDMEPATVLMLVGFIMILFM
jgi:hypothetical protein